MSNYHHDFDEWKDVATNFSGERWEGSLSEQEALRKIPEPEEVLYAAYTYEDYSGDAFVAYRNGDQFFVVEGSHCSCYGLEGQWEPSDPMDQVTFIELLLTYREDGWRLNQEGAKHILDNLGVDPQRKSKRLMERERNE